MLAGNKYQLIHNFLCVKGLVVHIEVSANLMFLLLFSSFEAVNIHQWLELCNLVFKWEQPWSWYWCHWKHSSSFTSECIFCWVTVSVFLNLTILVGWSLLLMSLKSMSLIPSSQMPVTVCRINLYHGTIENARIPGGHLTHTCHSSKHECLEKTYYCCLDKQLRMQVTLLASQ